MAAAHCSLAGRHLSLPESRAASRRHPVGLRATVEGKGLVQGADDLGATGGSVSRQPHTPASGLSSHSQPFCATCLALQLLHNMTALKSSGSSGVRRLRRPPSRPSSPQCVEAHLGDKKVSWPPQALPPVPMQPSTAVAGLLGPEPLLAGALTSLCPRIPARRRWSALPAPLSPQHGAATPPGSHAQRWPTSRAPPSQPAPRAFVRPGQHPRSPRGAATQTAEVHRPDNARGEGRRQMLSASAHSAVKYARNYCTLCSLPTLRPSPARMQVLL